jgi:hypothetical protein
MNKPTNTTKPAHIDHLSARLALQSATHHATRVVTRSAADLSQADPQVASRMRWARTVLASAIEGK